MSETEPTVLTLPACEHAVFTDDGRVFYDLNALIDLWGPIIEERRRVFFDMPGADESDMAFVSGQVTLMEMLKYNRDMLLSETITDISSI